MTTTPLIPPSNTSSSGSGSTSQIQNSSMNLKPTDFINMMITQLQNQDPLQPTSSQDLLSQVSQIGQLQSSTQLQSSLQTIALQSNIASAGNLIGKVVQGLDTNGAPMGGTVTSVQVANGAVSLQLDSGKSLSLSNVTSITNLPSTSATVPPA